MVRTKFYESTHQELIQEEMDLKIVIKDAEEERIHILTQSMMYHHEKESSDAEYYKQQQIWSLPWKTVRDMGKLLKQLEKANDEILFALRLKQVELKQAIEDLYGSPAKEVK